MVETYKCLNPVGIQEPVELYPLAPGLDKLDGKNIYLSLSGGGEQGITIPLNKELPAAYPNINWHIKPQNPVLSDEEIKTADAVIKGVLW